MTPRELAAHNGARVFDGTAAANNAGFVLTTSLTPRNVWNKASAALSIMHELKIKLKQKEALEIGLIVEKNTVTGCYLPAHPRSA
jgi:hypothetical protein